MAEMIDRLALSKLFGPVRHLGYIVPDLDAAIHAWRGSVGIGPFVALRRLNPFTNLKYRGQPSADVIISVAFAQSGPLQLELIQQHNDTPSIYTEALAARNHGPHHYAFSTAHYDQAAQHALDIGMEAIVETGERGSQRMTYFRHGGMGGFIAELIETSPETSRHQAELAAMLADADPNVVVIEAG